MSDVPTVGKREILVDAPGAGDWVLEREGAFVHGRDHCVSSHRDGQILGGIVICNYIGLAASIHMRGVDKHWCTREMLWAVFDYAFNSAKLLKLMGPVRSDQPGVISIDLRGGWFIEAVVKDVYAPGVHMVIMTMTRETCPWLNVGPTQQVDERRVANGR